MILLFIKNLHIKQFLCLILLSLNIAIAQNKNLQNQYYDAYEFARYTQDTKNTHEQAHNWAISYIENYAQLQTKTLYQTYTQAYNFATSKIMAMASNDADQWAQNFIIKKYRIVGTISLIKQIEELLNKIIFKPQQAKTWLQQFLFSSNPLYFSNGLLDNYYDIATLLRKRSEIAYNIEESEQAALKFIQTRYYFCGNSSLASQYDMIKSFAATIVTLDFSHAKAMYWSKVFIAAHGTLNERLSLRQQYQNTYEFARRHLIMDHDQASAWTLAFFKRKARFATNQSLFAQYQEAFLFAYGSDFLPILHQKATPAGIFLNDQAQNWAKDFIRQRGVLTKEISLTKQYQQLATFAYSSLGLKLEYAEAQNWAKNFIQRQYDR